MSIDDTANPPSQTDASHLQSQVKDDVSQVTEKAKHEMDAVTQRAAEDVRELRHQAEAKIGEATEQAKSFANDQKSLAAGQINGVAAAITKVADELDGSEQATVAHYARDLASGISKMGKTIEDRDVDDLMTMAQDFGRKQPLAFLGAAALAGFVASRFAMASSHRVQNKPATGQSSTGTGRSYGSSAASSSYGTSPSTSTASTSGSATGSTYGSSSYGSSTYGQNRTGGE